eukprot:11632105-Heterocapsa_arctica.AAC.1
MACSSGSHRSRRLPAEGSGGASWPPARCTCAGRPHAGAPRRRTTTSPASPRWTRARTST